MERSVIYMFAIQKAYLDGSLSKDKWNSKFDSALHKAEHDLALLSTKEM